MHYSCKPPVKVGFFSFISEEIASKIWKCQKYVLSLQPNNNVINIKDNTMALTLSEDGQTITNCDNHYSEAIVIPKRVKSIEYGAFLGCKGIQNISVKAGNPNFCVKDGALFNRDFTRLILVPRGREEFTIPTGVEVIGEGAFEGCENLTSIEIPSSVTVIREKAFSGCKQLSSLIIPNNVKEIWKEAFSDCSNLTSIEIPSIVKIENRTFEDCSNLTSIKIPDSVASIGEYAFSCCWGLTSIVIPSSVTSIGNGAFSNCTNLTSVIIQSRVTVLVDTSFPTSINGLGR